MNENKNLPDKYEGDINLSDKRKEWADKNINAETKKLIEEDAALFLHQSLSTPCLNALESCRGSHITDVEGRNYLDFHGNNVHQVGYGNQFVINAIKEQLDKLSFSPRRYTNETAIEFAKKLIGLTPGDLNRVLFATGGASAVGIALKIARVATKKFKTVSWWDSFHGASLDAISVGGETQFRKGIGPLLPGAIHVPPPSSYGKLYGDRKISMEESTDYIDYVMEHEGDIAAFIAEPIRYTTATIPSKEYWKKIRKICDKHEALLIFDEIPTCLGRTGKMFACENFDVVPDILCLGKGLGGGIFPMAAVITKESLNVAGDKSLGHYTHEKSPVGSAAGLATINFIQNEKLLDNVNRLGKISMERMKSLMAKYEIIGDIRGIGLLLGMELVKNRSTKEPAVDVAETIMYSAMEKGLSFKVSAGNVLTLMPPLTISEQELDTAFDILEKCFFEL
jgi:4-aminobutyrate aminotransferase